MGTTKRIFELKETCEAIINSEIAYDTVKGIARQILEKGYESLSERQIEVFEKTRMEFTDTKLNDPQG